jgi:NADH-quinone oxidoreductase subunit M
VEAPTAGSVLLAGVLLKLGGYGFFRYSLALLPVGSAIIAPALYTLALLGVLLGGLAALAQVDRKRIIAYSSIVHRNIVVLALFSFSVVGVGGGIFLRVAHGLISSALFLQAGILYNRHKSRLLAYYGGLSLRTPYRCAFLLFFTRSNCSFPLTAGFVGEFLAIVGLLHLVKGVVILLFRGAILTLAFSRLRYVRVANGVLNTTYRARFQDLT